MAKYKIDNLKNLSSKLSSEINRIGRQKLIKWNNQLERKDNPRYIYNQDGVLKINYDDNLNSLYKLNAEDYAKEILHFYSSVISERSIYQIYDLPDKNIISSLHSYSWDIKLDWLMNQPVIFITHPKIEYSLINDLENNTLIKRGLLNSEIIKLESDIKEINGIIKNLETEYNELKLKISNIDDSNNIQNTQLDKKDNTNPNVRKNSLLNWFNKTIPSKQDQRKSTFSNIENNSKPELLEEQLKNRIIELEKLQREKTDNENDLNKKLAKYNSLENELAQLRKIPDSLNSYINSLNNNNYKEIENKNNTIKSLINDYIENDLSGLIPYIKYLLLDSWYNFEFNKDLKFEYDKENNNLIVEYLLPLKDDIPNQVLNKKNEWKSISETKFKKIFEDIIFSIVIRTLSEIFLFDFKKYIKTVCFNGISKERSSFTGQWEEKYVLSLNVTREQIESLDLKFIQPKECFKFLKGVSAAKLYDLTEIQPIITPQFVDKRIINNKDIDLIGTPNIAEMDWEDFEHLVRQIFEWEFSDKGGEVKVTQSSRDGGVDAIVFDPDPIRGGKIIVQAKRYTNTVPVSAVRDLYGTIINEGANKGILITTSDYGSDSYKFAQGKPITLLNGGHLLFLLDKHGKKAHIDLTTAKEKNKETKFQR